MTLPEKKTEFGPKTLGMETKNRLALPRHPFHPKDRRPEKNKNKIGLQQLETDRTGNVWKRAMSNSGRTMGCMMMMIELMCKTVRYYGIPLTLKKSMFSVLGYYYLHFFFTKSNHKYRLKTL